MDNITNTRKTVDDFEVGQNVTYIPNHAYGDLAHEDCEHGRVSSKNSQFVFVKFDVAAANGQACEPINLI